MKVTLAVKDLVDARGWDLAGFAQQAGIDPETARHVYAGHSTELDLPAHARISQALGVLPNEILARVEEPQPSAADAEAPRTIDTSAYQEPTTEVPESGVVDDPRAALQQDTGRG